MARNQSSLCFHYKCTPKEERKKEKSKQGKKDMRNQNAEEGNMYFVYMMKCLLFRCGLSFCTCFWFCCCYCYLLIFLLRPNGPFFNPTRPSFVNELAHTKAPRPSFMHCPHPLPPTLYFQCRCLYHLH